MQTNLGPFGSATLTLTANEKVAVYSAGTASIYQIVGYANYPATKNLLSTVTAGVYVSSALTNGGTIVVEAGDQGASYEVGLTPFIGSVSNARIQGAPGTLNATGTLTSTLIMSGIVTTTSAAAVTATLDTGTVMDTASDFAISDAFDWSVINTGPNTFTVTAATGHTIVGAAAVATATSARFRTRKTAAATYVTYRLS